MGVETSTAAEDVYEYVKEHDELDPVEAFVDWMDRMRELAKLTKQVGDYLGNAKVYEILCEADMCEIEQQNASIISKLQETVFNIFCDQVTKEAIKGARQDPDFDKARFVDSTGWLSDLLADNAPDNLRDEVDWEPYAEEIMERIEDGGLEALQPYPTGDLAEFRRFELAAVLGRLRTLVMVES